MIKVSELYANTIENYRKNGIISHFIHFLLVLIGAGFILLSLFYADLFILIVPLITIPLIFVSQLSTILLRNEDNLTVRGLFNCIKAYFSGKFNSTYRVIRSALFSLAIYLGFAIVYLLTVNLILYNDNYMGYQSITADIVEHINVNTEDLIALYNKYSYFFEVLSMINVVPTLFVFCFTFFAYSNRYAVSLFPRLEHQEIIGRVDKMVQEAVIKNNRGKYNLYYFALNWPYMLLFILGFGLGAYLGYISLETYTAMFAIGLAVATFITFGLLGPFILAGNEAIYNAFKDKYELEFNKIKNSVSSTLEDLLKKMEEERNKDDEEK